MSLEMCVFTSDTNIYRRRPNFPGSLTDLHRYRKTAHGHDGSSRIVMVRKTDQRTFSSKQKGQEPKLETITRETIETFRGERTACKITTEKKGERIPTSFLGTVEDRSPRKNVSTIPRPIRSQNAVRKRKCGNATGFIGCGGEAKVQIPICAPPENLNTCNSVNSAKLKISIPICEPPPEKLNCCNSVISRPKMPICAPPPEILTGCNSVVSTKSKAFGCKNFFYTPPPPKPILSGIRIIPPSVVPFSDLCLNQSRSKIPQSVSCTRQKLAPSFEKTPSSISQSEQDTGSYLTAISVIKVKMSNFQKECLDAHNEIREKHGAPPLVLNNEMCKESQEFANKLVRMKNLQSSGNRKYGENIYGYTSTDPNKMVVAKEAVDHWYSTMEKHNFKSEPKTLTTGNFTQLVWFSSEELGVGYAKVDGKVVVVCNYSPPGNTNGEFVQNVLPLGTPVKPNPRANIKKDIAKGTEGDFEQEFLEAHNNYRRLHNVPDLTLDPKLCKFSEEWANILASKNILEHRKNNQYGENIFSINSTNPNITIAGNVPVDSWYAEIKDHPFGKEPHGLKSGHFSQVIWKTSESVGVGVAKKNGQIIVVANYSPAGNFVGSFSANVPPKSKSSNKADTPDSSYGGSGASYAYRPGENKPPAVKPTGGTPNTDTGKKNKSNTGTGEGKLGRLSTRINISDQLSSKLIEKGFNEFEIKGLLIHNDYRKKHGVPPLHLDQTLCNMAQEWADQCGQTGKMSHRPDKQYGENIFYAFSTDYGYTASVFEAVKNWYEEIRDYNFGVEEVNSKTLHFSQLIWRASLKLGIGYCKNERGETYIVANYTPRGNVVNHFIENVPPRL